MIGMRAMKRIAIATLLAAVVIHTPAQADILKTMPHGPYECALPGDAAGAAWIPLEGEGFTISRASRYRSPEGRGTYIMKGDELTFTAGPKNGQQLRRTGTNELRAINKDGTTGRMICVRVG
jgi:hypothetical protein